jgi:hypothetical protein
MNLVISDNVEWQFRHAVVTYKGGKKGSLSEAAEEALNMWMDYMVDSTPQKKTKLAWD